MPQNEDLTCDFEKWDDKSFKRGEQNAGLGGLRMILYAKAILHCMELLSSDLVKILVDKFISQESRNATKQTEISMLSVSVIIQEIHE